MDLGRPDRADRLEALAAEYALGTLSTRARRRLEAIRRRDARVASVVRSWEYRLAGLAEAVPAVTPAPRVWAGIQRRLGIGEAAPAPREPWWRSLALWRGLATAGLALAIGLGVLLMANAPEPQPVVVVLAGQDARPALIASAARGSRTLIVKAVNPIDVAPDRSLELWALPEGQNPRPLGLLPASGVARVSLPEPADAVLGNTPALAVSLEPAGGSPTGLPTGPVLYTGAVQRMY
ncbi:MAG TPA: anti-sigma factor [Casimicrobiaceae bacterium]|nr:anti-sigma factor [Casimicrobiaceae bacterium]